MTNNLSGQIDVPSMPAGTLTGTVNTNSGMTAVVNSTGIPMVGPSAFTRGNPGTTFTPVPDQVSPHEVELSWVNDGGKPNPDTVTIAGMEGPEGPRGLQGEQGEQGGIFTPAVSTAGVISWTNGEGLPNPASVNIKGPQGNQGIQGEQGPRGLQGETGDSTATIRDWSVS